MGYEVKWTPRALSQLRKIVEFISADNPPAAQKLRDRILRQTQLLTQTPRIGQLYPLESAHEIRQLIEGRYRIFYRIDEDHAQVHVMTVWHASRNEPRF